jgi:hypothetical protein
MDQIGIGAILMSGLIAILTHSVCAALTDRGRDFKSYNRSTQRGTFHSDREFMIVTEPGQLEGLSVSDYIIVGAPNLYLIECARQRLVA